MSARRQAPQVLVPLLAGTLLIGQVGCWPSGGSGRDAATGDAAEDADASPIEPRFPPCDPSEGMQTVTFVHVNDMHSTFHPDGASSPAARLRGYFDEVRAENPYALFTNSGDDHEKGWLAEHRSEGWASLEVVRSMSFDVRTIGNHDFAWGPQELLAHSRDPHGIVLASNVRWIGPEPSSFGAVELGKLDVGCLQVGFFGMVSQPWDERDEQYSGPFLPGYDDTRHDVVNVAQKLVWDHRDEVDLLVMVSHLGLDLDEHVAEWVYGIDVILSGHSHDVVYSPVNANGALLVQAGAYAEYAARLDVDVELGSGRRVARRFELVENTPDALPVDPLVEARVRALMAYWTPDADQPVAWLAEPRSAMEVAHLAARAATERFGAEAALVDPLEVWTDLDRGPVTPQQLLDAFKVEREPPGTPGFSSFYVVSISGADIERLDSELDPTRWAFLSDASLDPEVMYDLAVQKHVVFHPGDHLPAGIRLVGQPLPLGEAWATVHDWAQTRSANCLYLDVDAPLPSCR